MINRKTLFGVVATIAATSVFSITYPVELTCLLNEKEQDEIPPINTQEIATHEYLNDFPIVTFDKNFKPDNYLKYYRSCYKELLPYSKHYFSVGYNINNRFLYNDPSNMTSYLQANNSLFKDKLDIFFQSSINSFQAYDQFKEDITRNVTYITTAGTDVTNVKMASNNKYLLLYAEKGDHQIFHSTDQLNKMSAQNTAEIIADRILFLNRVNLDISDADRLAKFIVITTNSNSFSNMIDLSLSNKQELIFIHDTSLPEVSYEILSTNKNVINLKVMVRERVIALRERCNMAKKIDFGKNPIIIDMAMNMSISEDLTGMRVDIPFKDVKIDISPTPRYPDKSASSIAQMYLKASMLNGLQEHYEGKGYSKNSISKSDDIDIRIH